MAELTVVRPALPPAITDALTSAASYAEAEKAEATRIGYRSDWRLFSAWCVGLQLEPLPATPAIVAAYLAHLADSGLSVSTIMRRLSAITYAHQLGGVSMPPVNAEVRAVVHGIRRRLGVAVKRKAPATARAIAAMLEHVPDTLTGKRDRALLLIGFAAALRRSELAFLHMADVELQPDGLLVHIRRSKTDQEGEGHAVAIPRGARLKPVEAFEIWIAAAAITEGPIFRPIDRHGNMRADAINGKSVADIVKRYCAAAGFDPKIFAGHSLRAGFVTSALEHGADLFKVMDVTRHRRVETLKGYDRRARAFKDHAGRDFL